jgi:hypothetical protein
LNSQILRAGTGKCRITISKGHENDPLFAKALVIENDTTKVAIITLDVIAIGGIGALSENFMQDLGMKIQNDFGMNSKNILVNASHNHCDGSVILSNIIQADKKITEDIVNKTSQAVKKAFQQMETVKIGTGRGFEDRIGMNRRVKLKNGKVFTIRLANPNMPDDLVAGVGEIDTEIGILRIDRLNGSTKAVVYNYACHPYTGVPDGKVTAEFPGYASGLIEEHLGPGCMAFFLQGAAGDITEVLYKDVNRARDCSPFGQMLGLSTLRALKEINTCESNYLTVINESLQLPLRTDISARLEALDNEEQKLLATLRLTSLNIKSFIPLIVKYKLSPDYPSNYSYYYLQQEKIHTRNLKALDKANRGNMNKYLNNILAMETMATIEENKTTLRFSNDEIRKIGSNVVSVDIQGIRIGDFVVVSFPGEAFVQTGLNIKKQSPLRHTYFAGYSNGYIHYAPTSEAYNEWGYEDMRCILAPEWQKIYEERILKIIKRL